MKNANKLAEMSFICLFFVFVPFGIFVVPKTKSSYYSTLSKIQSMNSDISRILLYTDGSKDEFTTSNIIFAPIMRKWNNSIDDFDHFID